MNKKNYILLLMILVLSVFVLPKMTYAEYHMKAIEPQTVLTTFEMDNEIILEEANGQGYYSSTSPEINVRIVDENVAYQSELHEQLNTLIKQMKLSVKDRNTLSILLDGDIDFTPYLPEETNIDSFVITVGNPFYTPNFNMTIKNFYPVGTKIVSFSNEQIDIPLPEGREYKINFDFFTNYGEHIKFNMIKFNLEDISLANIETKPHTIVIGPNATWDISDSVVQVTDAFGNEISLSEVTISSGEVNVTMPGIYELEYTYIDIFNNIVVANSIVYVIETQAEIKTKDIVMEGKKDPWTAELNFIEAFDGQGKEIDLSKIQVHSEVDINNEGTYTVQYTYTDESGNIITSEALVTIFLNEDIVEKSRIIVKYVDELGDELLEDTILEGQLGEKYSTTIREIDGYTLNMENFPENAQGIYEEEDITVVYIYKKTEENTIDSSTNNIKNDFSDKILPNTGEKSSYFLSILGVMTLLLVVNFLRKKQVS